jgi:alkyldihydroxyacetonephosphate synthase
MIRDSIEDLRRLLGDDAVKTDDEVIVRHSYDAWPLAAKLKLAGSQPYKPDLVVFASRIEQIVTLLRWASEEHIPVTPWGAGSSVTGAPLPLAGGVSLDLSQMNRVLNVNETNLTVRVETGIMGHILEAALNQRGFTLNHSPQSLDRSTVGGWVATRATGQFSSRYGGIEDLIVSLKAVLPTGEVIETKAAPRSALGPDLRHVFIGSEGTMGVVVEITLRMFPLASFRKLEAIRFMTIQSGIDVMRWMMQAGLNPFLVRFYDSDEAPHAMKDPSFEHCVMFLGFEGLQSVAEAEYAETMQLCREAGGVALGPSAVDAWMSRRFDFSTVENLLATPGGYAETIEIAHFWDQIVVSYHALKAALAPLADEVLGHFSHVYTHGTSLYLIMLGRAQTDSDAQQRIRDIWEVSMSAAQEYGAAISHHHGIGIARLPYIQQELGATAVVLERIKTAMDPARIMSPGKLGLG